MKWRQWGYAKMLTPTSGGAVLVEREAPGHGPFVLTYQRSFRTEREAKAAGETIVAVMNDKEGR